MLWLWGQLGRQPAAGAAGILKDKSASSYLDPWRKSGQMGADFYDDAFLQQMFTSYAFGWGGQEISPCLV